jgi:PhzF family phenazine biosynthesis protein
MATHPFRIVNVFTQGQAPFTGNPLCVFEDGAGISDQRMQALARQFNLSETTFILPPDAKTRANARVRIFTPSYEMAFAGHPTLGTAQVCRALKLGGDSLLLEMQAGLVPVRSVGTRWTLTALPATSRELDVSREALAAALGLQVRDIGERPLWVKAGKEQLVVPLTSTDAVRRAGACGHGKNSQRRRTQHGLRVCPKRRRPIVGAVFLPGGRRNTGRPRDWVGDRQFRRMVFGDEATAAD